jgi:hypothetical protein
MKSCRALCVSSLLRKINCSSLRSTYDYLRTVSRCEGTKKRIWFESSQAPAWKTLNLRSQRSSLSPSVCQGSRPKSFAQIRSQYSRTQGKRTRRDGPRWRRDSGVECLGRPLSSRRAVRRALRRTGPNPTRATCCNLTLRLASRPWIQISRLSLHSLDRSRKLRNEQQFRIRAFRESKWLECWRWGDPTFWTKKCSVYSTAVRPKSKIESFIRHFAHVQPRSPSINQRSASSSPETSFLFLSSNSSLFLRNLALTLVQLGGKNWNGSDDAQFFFWGEAHKPSVVSEESDRSCSMTRFVT